jgi:hypothetical protein
MRLTHAAPMLLLAGCTYIDIHIGDETDAGVPVPPIADAAPPLPDADSPPLPCSCPQPTPGKFMICGRIYDLETSQPVASAASVLKVDLYDALMFANNPTATPPLGTATVDGVGCYRADDGGVTPPFTAYVAAATDDVPGQNDDWVRTAVAVPSGAGQRMTDVVAWATRHTTDQQWSTSAGLAGQTFAERGVYVGIFVDPNLPPLGPLHGTPVAGVRVTENGSVKATNDYPFADVQPLLRTTVAPAQDVTGPSGSVLYTGGTLTQYSGSGAEPAGCAWPSTLAATIPGAVFVHERVAQCP